MPYLCLLVLGTGFLIAQALLHHQALGTGYDLGIYDQVVWNLAHGNAFLTTLVYETGGFYDHFEPVLAMLAPLYWLWPDVRVLLIVQAVALGLGSLPIYLYASRRLGKIWPGSLVPALVLAAAYLLYPALHAANLNDFHEVSLLPPLLGFALYGLLTGRRRVLLVFLGLALLVKEDTGVTALAFSLYILLLQPPGFRRRDGLFMAVAVLIWVFLILNVLYPAVTHGMPYPFVDRRYGWLGDSPAAALRSLATRPQLALAHLLQPPKLRFLLNLFGPLLFLPLLGWPVIALCFPILGYLMLSDYAPQWSVQSYYNPPLLPFLFFALIQAFMLLLVRLKGSPAQRRGVLLAMLVLVVAGVGYGYYVFSPAPGGRTFSADYFRATPRTEAADRLLADVPAGASVSTIWPLVPHLSQRAQIYTVLARPDVPPEYMILEDSPGAEGAPLYPYAAPPGWPPVYHEYQTVQTSEPFRLQQLSRSLTLLPLPERSPRPEPLRAAAYAWLDGPQPGQAPAIAPGRTVRLMLAWERTARLERRYVFFVHLLDPNRRGSDGALQIVTQSGHEAGDGAFPTTLWETWTAPGIVLDTQALEVPAETAPGTYQAWAGVYDKETGQRVVLGEGDQSLLYVGSLTVAAR